MFERVKRFRELENDAIDYLKQIRSLREEVADLKLQRKIEDEDIKHMVKIKEGQLDIEFEKRKLQRDRECDAYVTDVKNEYRNKLEGFLKDQVKDVKEMYGQILKRLPDVNVRLKGDV